MKGATTLQDISYTRAPTGRITSVSHAGRPNDSWTYAYDTLDRLLTATNTGDASLSQTFSYDSAHNLTSNSAVGTYSYPAQGRRAGGAQETGRRASACRHLCRPVRASLRRQRQHDGEDRGTFDCASGADQHPRCGQPRHDVLPEASQERTTPRTSLPPCSSVPRPAGGGQTTEYRYRYTADNARALKISVQTAGPNQITAYLGPDAEIEPSGTWVKYVHDDVKRKGFGPTSQMYFHHRDHLKTIRVITDSGGNEVSRTFFRAYGRRADAQWASEAPLKSASRPARTPRPRATSASASCRRRATKTTPNPASSSSTPAITIPTSAASSVRTGGTPTSPASARTGMPTRTTIPSTRVTRMGMQLAHCHSRLKFLFPSP